MRLPASGRHYRSRAVRCSCWAACNGQCLASAEVTAGAVATGTCQRDVSQNFGCRRRIDGGKAQSTLCVD